MVLNIVSAARDAKLCGVHISGQEYFICEPPCINSLLHCHFHRIFLYSCTKPGVEFICRIAVIWLHRVMLHTHAQLFLWLQRVSRNDVRLPAKESVCKIVKLSWWASLSGRQNRVDEATLISTNHSTPVWPPGACPVCTSCMLRNFVKKAMHIFARFQFLIAVLMLVEMPIIWKKGNCCRTLRLSFCYSFREYSYNQYISQLMHLIRRLFGK